MPLDYTHRSPSQLNEYTRCPYGFYLSRVEKVWKRPAAWLAHGTAFHSVAEAFEKSGRVMTPEEGAQLFRSEYIALIADELKTTPNAKTWFSSGRYKGPVDINRRMAVGLEQVEGFFKYHREHPEDTPWVDPSGQAWVEEEFTVKFGNVVVKGYIDVVVREKPRDYKTGSTPGGDEQLATYAGVLNLKFDIPFTTADFWMAKIGRPTRPYDISDWSIERLADVYGTLDEKIKAEEFEPKPDPDICMRCPVSTSCEFKYVD